MVHVQLTEVPEAGAKELARWALRRRARFRVTGASMEPTLCAGDVVLVARNVIPLAGDIVVAHHPHEPGLDIVKRVDFVDDGGTAYLKSDNATDPSATDSSTLGLFERAAILGRVMSKIRR